MKTCIQRQLMLLTAVIVLGVFNITQSHATGYVITDLGTLSDTKSEAYGINNNGDVVGRAYLAGDIVYHAFLHSGGVMTDLGVDGCTDPYGKSHAFRINNFGQIAGISCMWVTGRGNLTRAFIYDAGVMIDLGTLGGSESGARAINNSGHVAGFAGLAGDAVAHAFVYSGGVMTDLGTLGGSISQAYGINDSDQVVGTARYNTSSVTHAFLYSEGVMTDLTPTLDTITTAWDINNAGQIVGSVGAGTGAHAFIYSGGVLTDLGVGAGSEALGINNNGVIVGWYYAPGPLAHAFLYDHGVWTDLNTLLPEGSGWVLNYAADINDNGRIAGIGTINGQSHGFVAAPAYPGDFAPADCDVDGKDLAALIVNPGLLNLATFAGNFGKNACQ